MTTGQDGTSLPQAPDSPSDGFVLGFPVSSSIQFVSLSEHLASVTFHKVLTQVKSSLFLPSTF